LRYLKNQFIAYLPIYFRLNFLQRQIASAHQHLYFLLDEGEI